MTLTEKFLRHFYSYCVSQGLNESFDTFQYNFINDPELNIYTANAVSFARAFAEEAFNAAKDSAAYDIQTQQIDFDTFEEWVNQFKIPEDGTKEQ